MKLRELRALIDGIDDDCEVFIAAREHDREWKCDIRWVDVVERRFRDWNRSDGTRWPACNNQPTLILVPDYS